MAEEFNEETAKARVHEIAEGKKTKGKAQNEEKAE